jgi:hypothetical protein
MHEVSFQDKEKEHLTRLQDAEEMKVCNKDVHAFDDFGPDFLILEKSTLFTPVHGSV